MRVEQGTVRVGLAGHSKANLSRLDESDLQIRHWTWNSPSSICYIGLARIADNEARVAVGLDLQPDELVAIAQPLRVAGTGIIRDKSRPARVNIKNADLVGLGMRVE